MSRLGFSRNVSGQKLLVYHIFVLIHRGAKLYSQRRANLNILNSAPGLFPKLIVRSGRNSSSIMGFYMPKFELIQDFMSVLVACMFEEDLIKNDGDIVSQHFLHNNSTGIFSGSQGRVTPKLIWLEIELVQNHIAILDTSK